MDLMEEFFDAPLYQKSEEISDTLKTFSTLCPKDDSFLILIDDRLSKAGSRIQEYLTIAEESKLYDVKMGSAVFIRDASIEIMALGYELEKYNFADVKYFNIVYRLIEEFRILFLDWIAGFNRKHFVVDKWDLFNPPGISRNHIQSKEELDFLKDDGEDD